MSSVASQLSGSPASPSKLWVARGQATILNTTQTIAVADTSITANSLVVVSGAKDGAKLYSVSLVPSTGFEINASAAVAGDKKVNWAVLAYN